jgi:hypothetical protein
MNNRAQKPNWFPCCVCHRCGNIWVPRVPQLLNRSGKLQSGWQPLFKKEDGQFYVLTGPAERCPRCKSTYFDKPVTQPGKSKKHLLKRIDWNKVIESNKLPEIAVLLKEIGMNTNKKKQLKQLIRSRNAQNEIYCDKATAEAAEVLKKQDSVHVPSMATAELEKLHQIEAVIFKLEPKIYKTLAALETSMEQEKILCQKDRNHVPAKWLELERMMLTFWETLEKQY